MKKRVLVTGGAGFIGSHLADRLLALGHHVVIVDNESTGLRANIPPQASYIRGDVRRADELEQAFAHDLDAVFHVAGQASTIRSFADPAEDLEVNVIGTLNVVQKCLEHQVPRMLFASSMTAYGHPERLPVEEEAPCKPISYYGIAKFAAERYVQATHQRTDLVAPFNATSFRMFNVYGSRQRLDNPYQGVAGIFIGHALRQEPITIHGDGSQTRDFVHIDDVVNAWVSAWENQEAFGRVFNLGMGVATSVRTLANTILRAAGHSPNDYPFRHEPLRPGDQRHMLADVSRALSILDWTPHISLEDGISETVDWARLALES